MTVAIGSKEVRLVSEAFRTLAVGAMTFPVGSKAIASGRNRGVAAEPGKTVANGVRVGVRASGELWPSGKGAALGSHFEGEARHPRVGADVHLVAAVVGHHPLEEDVGVVDPALVVRLEGGRGLEEVEQ